MKKENWKRLVAALGAALLVFQTPAAHMNVLAGTVSENEPAAQQSAVSENTVTEQKDLLVNYAYIEHASLEKTQAQNVLISLGGETVAFLDAQLVLEHVNSGETVVIPVSGNEDNLLRFAFDTAAFAEGVYRVAELIYTYFENENDTALKNGVAAFSQIPDMEQVCFGVGEENPLAAEDFVTYDAQAVEAQMMSAETVSGAADLDVVTIDPSENMQTSADKLSEAIAKAQTQNVSDTAITAERSSGVQAVPAVRAKAENVVVVLDPGHDITHAGARANGLEEEDLTLAVAEHCKNYLEKNYSNVTVYMTRYSAACPHPGTTSGDDNAKRVDASAKVGADVYVSLHFNSTVGTTTATGAMVFYPNSNYNSEVGAEGAGLAAKIIAELAKVGLKNNGIRIYNSQNNTTYPDGSLADYYGVIKRSKEYGIPAVIVEHAFLNNASDAAFLAQEGTLQKLGEADAMGIAQAYGLAAGQVEYTAQSLLVTDIDGGNGTFKMSLNGVTPADKVAKVEFQVYPTDKKKASYTYTAQADTAAAGTYYAEGQASNHDEMTGEYQVIAYVYNAAGKSVKIATTTFEIEETDIDTSKMELVAKASKTEKTVKLTLKGNEKAADVYFRVYSKEDGTDDVKTYRAEQLDNGYWRATVDITKHKKAGEYIVIVYSTNHFGTKEKAMKSSFTIVGPTARKAKVVKQNHDKGTFQVRAYNVTSTSKVKKVEIKVKNLDGKKKEKSYTVKKHSSGFYYADVDMKNHNYEYGDYNIDVIVTDKNGIVKTVANLVHTIEQPQPEISVKLKSKQTKLTMSASDLGLSANVKDVKFRVYNTAKASKKKYYPAKKSKDGSWSASASISDFGTSGTYKVLVYVKGANGKYRKLKESVKIQVADITGGETKVKKKSASTSYFYVSDIEYKGAVSSVEVTVWPKANKKAKYTYKASKRWNGEYRALLDITNHRGLHGAYGYKVTVTAKNGIEKELLRGEFQLGDADAQETELYAISGASSVTVNQMVAYYNKNATYPEFYSDTDAPNLQAFCKLYYSECEKEGIRAEVAFAQAMKETNFLRYGGDVDISQFNFAGLGATGGGAKGLTFASVQVGIRAQVQHLKAYANSEPLAQTCVDPRFQYVQRGCAPYVEWLGISENPYGKGWATDPTYGSSLRGMVTALKNS